MTKQKTVMVVDDSSTSTFLMESFFEENGYDVIIAEDGSKALKKLEATTPDVIFLDLMMPKMSGFDVLSGIKKIESAKEIPVIIISAKTEIEDINQARKLGAIEYMYKPIDIERALQLLHKLKI
ncbi:MAG: response regulator [Salinivirgaceae bacterium]|jgi:sigma-B regulation protein RsbU (phosphoserine phosphatase)|nr:response regulator [Salinivirgaceae bacterium]